MRETLTRYPNLSVCSFDKGFHSPENQIELTKLLDRVVLPKKGRCNKRALARQNSESFKTSHRKHSAVESEINALVIAIVTVDDAGKGSPRKEVHELSK